MRETVTLLMPLLDDGTDVWRPVSDEALGDDLYRIVGRPEADERWAFPVGSLVRCRWRTFGGG
ncbi:hypothetical protein [Ancylobacter terrae]|uniref:hypothetical protein n=1 Tax=Ancylobacter sp. sgz301288 TaxID=3342077 RepID=UPI00385C6485